MKTFRLFTQFEINKKKFSQRLKENPKFCFISFFLHLKRSKIFFQIRKFSNEKDFSLIPFDSLKDFPLRS